MLSQQPDEPLLYIDETLAAPQLFVALDAAGYRVVYKDAIRDFDGVIKVKDDEHIIPWLTEHEAIWIHADDRARVEHAKLLIAGSVRSVWIYRPGGGLSLRQQLRILAYSLPRILDGFQNQRRHSHYEVRLQGMRPDAGISVKPFTL